MTELAVEYQFRIRNAANTDNVIVATSVRGGTNPYIVGVPTGDGATLDPITGVVASGSMTVRVADPITSGTTRLITSLLEDADDRQQLGHRRAFVEFREDGGSWTVLAAGRIQRFGLVSDIEWEFTVGDWMRAEHEHELFKAADGETVADFLARWPLRGYVIGNPDPGAAVSGLQLQAWGGWEMRVHPFSYLGHDFYWLEPIRVWGPPTWSPGQKFLESGLVDQINEYVQDWPRGSFALAETPITTVASLYKGHGWPGLIFLIDGEPFRAVPLGVVGLNNIDRLLLSNDKKRPGAFAYAGDDQDALTEGQVVRLKCLSVRPSALSPIYWYGHPVDFLDDAWTDAGIPFDATAREAVRDSLGADARLSFQFTRAEPMGALLEQAIYGPFGVGARQGDDGEVEAFVARRFTNDTSTLDELTDADVADGSVAAFDLDAGAAIRQVTLTHQRLSRANQSPDGVVKTEEQFIMDPIDANAIGTAVASYNVPGQISWLDANDGSDGVLGQVAAIATDVFSRRGRGGIGASLVALRGGAGDSMVLGQEILVDVAQLPNHNKRLGDDGAVAGRAMQIVRRTPTLVGYALELEDSGPNAQPVATLPEITVAASTDLPRSVAEVTITNAAALNAADIAVRLQMSITDGSAPAAEDYIDVDYLRIGEVPTDPVRLPTVVADRTIFVRARSEQPDKRPSDWSEAESVALDPLDAPTDVTVTPDAADGTQALVEWTVGGDSDGAHVEVTLRLTSQSASAAVTLERLLPGSVQYALDGLTPDEDYTVGVRHLDLATGDLSALTTEDFTAESAVPDLASPSRVDGFSYQGRSQPPLLQLVGIYGLAVAAANVPGVLEYEEAIETSIGSGTYGSFAVVGRVDAVLNDWTIWQGEAPNDGLRRRLRARQVIADVAQGDYSDVATVTPWSFDPLTPYATSVTAVLDMRFVEGTGPDDDHYYGEIQVIDSTPQGDDSVTVFTEAGPATSTLIDPTAPATGGMGAGLTTASFDTTEAVACEFLKPEPWAGETVETFFALADNRLPVEVEVTVPERDIVTPVISGIDVTVDDYGPPNSIVTVTFSISGDYDHIVVFLVPDGGAEVEQAADQVTFNLTTLFGWNLRSTPGVQTHDLGVRIEARDPDEAVLDNETMSPDKTYDADPDS